MEAISSTDSYLSFVLSLGNLSHTTILSAFFLILARLLPVMMIAPFFGSKNVAAPIRILFSISLVAILLPYNLLQLKGDIVMNMAYTGYLIKEMAVGFVIAFIVTVPFYIALTAGSFIDHIRGSASLQVADPTTSSMTGPIGLLLNYVLIVVFFGISGPFLFFDALIQSFEFIPIDSFINPLFFNSAIPFWQRVIGLADQIVSLSLQLGAPSIIGILMAEMFLGITNRLAPQVQIVFLGISLKSWIGLALLAAAWFFIIRALQIESFQWIKILKQTIQQAGVK
jgi:type III secretion protein T